MAEFQPFDLGHVIQTSEAIKAIRRQGTMDKLQEQYLGQQIDASKQNTERQTRQDQLVLGQQKAQQIVAKTGFILQAPNPKNYVEQNEPELIEQLKANGTQWESLTDDQVKQVATAMQQHAQSELGKGPGPTTIGDVKNPSAGILQQDAEGNIKQVVAPRNPDYEPAKMAEDKRHNIAMENKMPAGGFGALTDTTQADTLAHMIASGAMPMPTGRALLTPLGQYLTSKVNELNPDFAGSTYPTQAAALKAFTSGAESKKVRSLNTAIAHMASLDELSLALNNKDTQAFNRVANFLSKETGGTAVTNFNTAKDLVAKEVIAAVVAGGGGQAEREEAAKSFNAANSPQQLAEVTNVYRDLLGGQLHSLSQQYEQGTNRKDFARFLTDRTKKALGTGHEDTAPPQQPNQPPQQPGLTPGSSYKHASGATVEILQ